MVLFFSAKIDSEEEDEDDLFSGKKEKSESDNDEEEESEEEPQQLKKVIVVKCKIIQKLQDTNIQIHSVPLYYSVPLFIWIPFNLLRCAVKSSPITRLVTFFIAQRRS